MNTSAFSANDEETETRRSNYEAACNRALAAGYHLAFSSNQDNHCANWGTAYGNRTAVLVPAGAATAPLSREQLSRRCARAACLPPWTSMPSCCSWQMAG
jgi:hypothetical protein